MAVYRMSITATVVFDVIADSDEQAIDLARDHINNQMPECYEIGDERHTCAYPHNADENLEIASTLDEPEPQPERVPCPKRCRCEQCRIQAAGMFGDSMVDVQPDLF